MSARFRRGLVVGKFCPLHLGHELLIRRAQAKCETVLLLSYTKPGYAGYDRERRAGWLQTRFPELEAHVVDDDWLAARCDERGVMRCLVPDDDAPDDVHRHFVAWLLLELMGTTIDSVFTSEDYGDGFAAVLAREFGAPVTHVCVDQARIDVPVSGSQVRRDPMACRHLLSPEVYADLVPRIALLGAESTGKTTLARMLAEALGTEWVPEYGRELWDERGGVLTFQDMAHIARTQIERERQKALVAQRLLVCDTTPITTLLYSEFMFRRVAEELQASSLRPYTLTFLCAADFPFEQDGTRRDLEFQKRQQAWYERALVQREIEFQLLEGSAERRLAAALGIIHDALG